MAEELTFDPIPEPPSFSQEQWNRCRETGNFAPILFEWYKFVGGLNVLVAHIQRSSPAFREIPVRHYYALVGLLNRCARLMLSNIALSHEGRFGETTAIVDRCIFESGVKVTWLCNEPSDEKFKRFFADGLKTEFELKAKIEANIVQRKGEALPIEERMLRSIARHIKLAGLTEAEIAAQRKLPDLASMLTALGLDRLIYITAQKIGSHHVHGTWPGLLFHYLEEDANGELVPRGHECSTHINQFVFVPRVMLTAMAAYLRYAMRETTDILAFTDLFENTDAEIMKIYTESVGGDLSA